MNMFRRVNGTCFIVALLSCFNAFSADEPTIMLLSERRPSLNLPPYSLEQKKTVLDQVRLVMSQIFVHRELKLKDFGPLSDPLPLLDNLEKEITTISDRDFHKNIADIFAKQRDFHTSYIFPTPYSCYRSFIPISFKEVIDNDGNKAIAVFQISDDQDVMRLMPRPFRIEVGDIVLTYDGMSIEEALQKASPRSRGANPAAIRRHSANLLTFVSQAYELTPEKNETTLVLKNRLGKTYTVTLPWVSRVNQQCLKPDDNATKKNGKLSRKLFGENDYQNEFNKLFRKKKSRIKSGPGELKDTLEPILKYKTVENEFGTFGYFYLESFVPEKLSVEGVILEVKKLLQHEFANTDGLIIDLRNNGGGMIDLADGLVQLFTPKNPIPMNFRQKSSPENLFYMEKMNPNSTFTEALRVALRTGATYTTLHPISAGSEENANNVGQYYFKPVAVLTNSSCYSSCDMFTAHLQDHEAAVIFGEDRNTGAGGANNYNLTNMYNDLPQDQKGPFRKLPNNQNIGFSFRQTVRVGLNAGILIEDMGVIADSLAAPSLSDLYNRSQNQLKIISRRLNKDSEKFTSWIKLDESKRPDFRLNEVPSFFARWEETSAIEFKTKEGSLGLLSIELNNQDGRDIFVPEALRTTEYKIVDFEMLGFDSNKRVWRKKYNFRTVPDSFTLLGDQNLEINLDEDLPSFMALYTLHTKAGEGWTIRDGALKIGNGLQYVDNVHAEASIFVTLPVEPLKLNFEAELMTEKDYDFFTVTVVSDKEEVILVQKTSGQQTMKTYSFDLSSFSDKKVELKFVFDSDSGVTDKGVTVQNISLTH